MDALVRPTLLVDESIARANIRRMAAKAAWHGLNFRPHFKTHQSQQVAHWFREEGVTSCTVSSVQMATYFAAGGWRDITIAFPVNPLEAESINALASNIRLNLLAVNEEALHQLVTRLRAPVSIWIEVDTGYHRTGVDPDDDKLITSLLQIIDHHPLLSFAGFLSHAGHSYKARSLASIQAIHDEDVRIMQSLKRGYLSGFPALRVSIGDTPSCSVCENFDGVDEIRPGNFVFYDLTQVEIGSCTAEQIAVAMACPVVAVYPQRAEVIIHGGGVHFSKDSLTDGTGISHFGRVVRLTGDGWQLPVQPAFVRSLSQEHGIVTGSPEWIANTNVGDVIGILPVHACLAADAMGELVTTSNERLALM
ncbi:MAG: alanine racemase [Cyclobacteriaceae bacterium]|jgi:D-serine deaminase-like pyridoxal phosphate-dependent protein